MTETYAAVRDALEHALVRSVAVTVPRLPRLTAPWYLPPKPLPSAKEQEAAFGRLAAAGTRMRRMDPAKKAEIEARYRRQN